MSQSHPSKAVQSDDVLADEATQIRTSARRRSQLQSYVETLIPSHLDIPVEVVVSPHVDRAFVAPADPGELISADGSSLSRNQARDLVEQTGSGYVVVVTAQETDTDSLSVSHQSTVDKEFQFALALHETLHILKTAVKGQHDILESEVDPQRRDYVDRLINTTEDGAIEHELRTGDGWSNHAATRITLARKVTSSTPPTDSDKSLTYTFADALSSGVYEYLIYDSGTLGRLLDPQETSVVFESADARRLFISLLPSLRELRDDIFALRSDSTETLYRDDKQQSIKRAKRTIEFWNEVKGVIEEADSDPPEDGPQSGQTDEDHPAADKPTEPQPGSDSPQQSGGDTQPSPDIDPDNLSLEPQETEPPSQSPTEKPGILDEPAPEDVPLNETDTDRDSSEEADGGPESSSSDSNQESPSSEDTTQSSGSGQLDEQEGECEEDGQQGGAESGERLANEVEEQRRSGDTATSEPQAATDTADADAASNPADDSSITTETDAENTQLASIAEETQSGSSEQENSQPTLSDFGSLGSDSDQQEDSASDALEPSTDDSSASIDSEQEHAQNQNQQQEDHHRQDDHQNDHHQDDEHHDDYQQDEGDQNEQPETVEDQQTESQGGKQESGDCSGSSTQDTQSEVPTEAETLSVDDLATDPTRLDREVERETADSEALSDELNSLNGTLDSSSGESDSQLVQSVENLPVLPDNTSSRHRSVAASWDTLKQSAQTVTATLEKELQLDQRTDARYGLSSGNFNSKTGYRLSYGDPRTFSRTHEGDKKRYFLVLVLDRSGSMSSFGEADKIEPAVQAVAQVAVAAEELGIDVAVIDFCDGEARLAKPASVDVDHAKDALLGLETGGGTPLADALALSQDVIDANRSRNQQALTIAITDDRPDDVEAVKSELQTFRTPVCSLTIATDQQKGDLPESAAELERAYEVSDTVFEENALNDRLDKFASLLGRF